jgi:hypothetical protein
LQKTHSSEGQEEEVAAAFSGSGGRENRLPGKVSNARMKFLSDQAVAFNARPVVLLSMSLRSSDTMRDVEKRKGMPKLDSALI